MKKLVIFVLLILILPLVLAVETTLKQNYQPRETLIAEITGNFIDNLEPENILFYSGRLYTPMIYDLTKIQDKYYLYSILPDKQRNYTLIIKNAHYSEAGQEKQEDIKFDFAVSGNLSLFNINPGFIVTNKDFEVKVDAIKPISLNAEFLSKTSQIEIPEGTKTLKFSVADIDKFTLTYLILKDDSTEYKIPVAIYPIETSIEKPENLRFSKNYFNFTVLEKEDFAFPITLINTGQENITDIKIESNIDIIKIKPDKIPVLEKGNSTEIIVTINSDKEEIIEGIITASSETLSSEISLTIITTKNKEEFQEFTKTTEILEQKSCSDLKGFFCEDNEECTGTQKLTIDGLCCVGSCESEEKSGLGKTIALIIILIIIIIIVIFVFRKLKARKLSSKEILKDKTQEYEERFKTKSQEVRNRLTRT